MAKIKSNGKILAEISGELLRASDLTNWEKITYRFMESGKVLKKLDCRFLPDAVNPNGRKHSYGWKVAVKKTNLLPSVIADHYRHRLEKSFYENIKVEVFE